MIQNDNLFIINKTQKPKNVVAYLNPDFPDIIGIYKLLKILNGD